MTSTIKLIPCVFSTANGEKNFSGDIPPCCGEFGLGAGYVNVGDSKLYVEERGEGVSMVILHGVP